MCSLGMLKPSISNNSLLLNVSKYENIECSPYLQYLSLLTNCDLSYDVLLKVFSKSLKIYGSFLKVVLKESSILNDIEC